MIHNILQLVQARVFLADTNPEKPGSRTEITILFSKGMLTDNVTIRGGKAE